MKKKHRDIVVDGVKYGWMIDGYNHVKIWKDKKVMAEYDIEYHHDSITPSMVAGLIKDPVITLAYLNAEPCPFCGGKVTHHPNEDHQDQYFVCYHKETCWLNDGKPPYNFNLIPINVLAKWNRRS